MRLIPCHPYSFLLWEKSTPVVYVSWKFQYIILSLVDTLRAYGKFLMRPVWQVRPQSKTFLEIASVLTELGVQLVFCFVFALFLTSNTISSVTRGPHSACHAMVGYPVLTEMAAVQDKPVTPHSSTPKVPPRFLFLVHSSLLYHMT